MYLMVAGLAPKNFVQLLIFAAAAGAPLQQAAQALSCESGVLPHSTAVGS
jgi:hypothetical protein